MARSFTTEGFARRMARAADQARDAGLAGVLVTPGPDLVYFTGYTPMAITERITMLVINVSRDPAGCSLPSMKSPRTGFAFALDTALAVCGLFIDGLP